MTRRRQETPIARLYDRIRALLEQLAPPIAGTPVPVPVRVREPGMRPAQRSQT